MKKLNKNLFLRVVLGVFICLAFNYSVFPYVLLNGAGSGYGNGGANNAGGEDTLSSYIIEGAGYFLDGNSDILQFLKKIELAGLQGLDYNELQRILSSGSAKMQAAVDTYEKLINTAELTPYNESVTAKLGSFDYPSFMKERGLNGIIFKEVEDYLKGGDITGTFKALHLKCAKIVEMLVSIKDDIDLNKFPDLEKLWNVNQGCSQTLLFGQYIAEVFYAIN